MSKFTAEEDLMVESTTPTAADLRAELARLIVARYVLAGRIGLDPTSVGRILNGKQPLTPEMVERIEGALNGLIRERAEASR